MLLETTQVMRDGVEVTINKCDLHLEKKQPKKEPKKVSKKESKKSK